MLVSISNTHEVKSNKESGFGRYAHIKKCDSTTQNLMIIPKNTSKPGIIIEFKKINVLSKETIEQGTAKALQQIDDMEYDQDLASGGVKDIIKLAIVFKKRR